MHHQCEQPRAALAEQAAQLLRQGHSAEALLAALRRRTTAELLRPQPRPRTAIDLPAELEALCSAAQAAVRRRAGWLYFSPPQGGAAVAARRRLLQGALLCFLRDALKNGSGAAIICEVQNNAAIIRLRSGSRGCSPETAALLLKLAQECGGHILFAAKGCFSAAVRLPLCVPAIPVGQARTQAELLEDRYSPLYLYLPGYCADTDK